MPSIHLVEGIVVDRSSVSPPGSSIATVNFSFPHKTTPYITVTAETNPVDSGEGNVNVFIQEVNETRAILRVSEEFRGKIHVQAWSEKGI
mgnify:CR=1 FL=1